MKNDRWFFDQTRDDIATIRRSGNAQNYESPEVVEQMIKNGPDRSEMTEENMCPTCGQYVDACSGCGSPISEHDED